MADNYDKNKKSTHRGERTFRINSMPENPVVGLKRFGATCTGKTSATFRIDRPVEDIDVLTVPVYYDKLDPKKFNTETFDILGVICQIPAREGALVGHYVYYQKNSSGKWTMFDDSHITTDMPWEDIRKAVEKNCYFLLYERRTTTEQLPC